VAGLRKVLPLLLVAAVCIGAIAAILLRLPSCPAEEAGIEALARSVAGAVEEIRGLEFVEEPRFVVVSREWVIEHWGRAIAQCSTAWLLIYRLTLLVGPGYNATASAYRFTASIIAATSGNTVYIVRENFAAGSAFSLIVLAHELTHVLQGQHFTLPQPETLDQRIALMSLIEGDADLVAEIYAARLNTSTGGHACLPTWDPPLAIMYFPYVYGVVFVRQVYELGGWEIVNSLYERPPTTALHVLRPDLYLNGTKPIEPTLNLTALAGPCSPIHRDRLGPAYILALIARYANLTFAERLAAEWRGDAVELAENETHYVLAWCIVWRSRSSALEFYRAYVEVMAELGGREVVSGIWRIGGITVSIWLRGSYVLILSTAYKGLLTPPIPKPLPQLPGLVSWGMMRGMWRRAAAMTLPASRWRWTLCQALPS